MKLQMNTSLLASSFLLFVSQSQAQVVVNEVGDKGTFGICGGTVMESGEDYIELKNTDSAPVDISGFVLHDDNGPDDTDVYTFPAGSEIAAGGFLLLCRDDTFAFGIGGSDTITLVDTSMALVSTSGALSGSGSELLSFQRLTDGTYEYRLPTPGADTSVTSSPSVSPVAPPPPATSSVVVNEVGSSGTFNVCGGTAMEAGEDYIELKNTGSASEDLSGYIIHDDNGPDDADVYTFPAGSEIAAGGILLLCRDDTFAFGIGGSDTITVVNGAMALVSTSGTLDGSGSELLSLQRLPDGTYEYRAPTPGSDTSVTLAPSVSPVAPPPPVASPIVVNEVGSSGTFNVCGGTDTEAGEDFIELKNTGSSSEDISGYILHDDNGPDDEDAYTFPAGSEIAAGGLLLLCRDDAFAFGIGGTDSISLLTDMENPVFSTGPLDDMGSEFLSYQLVSAGSFEYLAPTPGTENIDVGAATSSPSAAPTSESGPNCGLFCRIRDFSRSLFDAIFGKFFDLFD